MSENVENRSQPALPDKVQELQGKFPNDAALQNAIGQLELAGFDHADLSLPDPHAEVETPDSAQAATGEVDRGQLRTMASGMAGTTAGFAVAGVLMATGGLAAPVVAAIGGASAVGTVLATSGASNAVDAASAQARDRLGAEGKLILAVRTPTPELQAKAEDIFRAAGATDIVGIVDVDQAHTRGVGSASWTG